MAQDGSHSSAVPSIAPDAWADFDMANEHFKRLFPLLQDAHWGAFVAVSADGDYTVGANHSDAVAKFEATHGKKRATTFYIGIR